MRTIYICTYTSSKKKHKHSSYKLKPIFFSTLKQSHPHCRTSLCLLIVSLESPEVSVRCLTWLAERCIGFVGRNQFANCTHKWTFASASPQKSKTTMAECGHTVEWRYLLSPSRHLHLSPDRSYYPFPRRGTRMVRVVCRSTAPLSDNVILSTPKLSKLRFVFIPFHFGSFFVFPRQIKPGDKSSPTSSSPLIILYDFVSCVEISHRINSVMC